MDYCLVVLALVAPFCVHEAGHALFAFCLGVPLRWWFRGLRLCWEVPDGTPQESLRGIASGGFLLEFSVALGAAFALPGMEAGAFALAALAHFAAYPWIAQSGPNDFDHLGGGKQ